MNLASGFTRERPLRVVPGPVSAVLAAALALQIAWHALQPRPAAGVEALPPAPSLQTLKLASLGEEGALARILMLWLQAFDYQPGISIPFRQLDYHRIIGWLDVIQDLDPDSVYPLLSAARVYSEVPDNGKRRLMLSFVYRKFLEAPDRRWPWMAHAVYVAAHLIGDRELALKYARAIRTRVTPGAAPDWAVQMELFVLADLGRVESARVLLGALLESGEIKDRKELEFLKQRLDEAEKESE